MKKTNKILALTAGLVATLAVATFTTSCSGSNVDSTKTQLYVLNYQGGYGKKWLENAAARYEKLHAEDSYESGKKGVQVLITEEKTIPQHSTLKTSNYELICFEGMNYDALLKDDVVADITKYVTGTNPYETGKTIESKMFDEQKDFFKYNGKYYALPHYVGSFGIVYNKKVFNDYCLYFIDGYEEETPGTEARFISKITDKKSAGPDGKYDTYDDGLPVTYDEYYELCNYISPNMTPIIYMGKNSYNYLGDLICAMAADYDGVSAYAPNFTMNGTFRAAKLNSGETDVVKKADGSLDWEEVTVHPEKVDNKYDGYEIQRSASKYYAMDFMHELIHNKSDWVYDRMSDSLLHTDAQRLFVKSQFGSLPSGKDTRKNKPVAMLLEGNWWESEASEVFSSLTDAQKADINYGWMPLPRAKDAPNTTPTTLNVLTSYMFVKSGLKDFQTAMAADFLQYLNTDEAYVEFTTTTSAIKSFKYELGDKKSELTTFGKSFWDYFQASDHIFGESHNDQFVRALSDQQLSRRYFTDSKMTWPSKNFENDSNETAGTYLAKMYKYYRDSIWKTL